jgi:Fission yeast centromere protein N-terminal domain/Tc5 transposase DNA-binding domain
MPRKQAMTIEHRRALRNWAHSQRPKPSQKACIDWFYTQFNHKLSQSTVSESLSSHFKDLDESSTTSGQRLRTGQWPELEKVLFDWQQRIDSKGGFTTGELLREKAQHIWISLPEYANQPCPDFSSGWLTRFKSRYNIKQYTRHGEAGSVSESLEEEMRGLQTVAGSYKDEDVYNMDESGLFWKLMISRGLSSQSLPGLKKNKVRITIVLCVNATGSDRFPLWFIGKGQKHLALYDLLMFQHLVLSGDGTRRHG